MQHPVLSTVYCTQTNTDNWESLSSYSPTQRKHANAICAANPSAWHVSTNYFLLQAKLARRARASLNKWPDGRPGNHGISSLSDGYSVLPLLVFFPLSPALPRLPLLDLSSIRTASSVHHVA